MTVDVKTNEIYHSDCLVLMESMGEEYVDLTVTSPPYDDLRNYKGYHFDFENIAKALYRVTKTGGVVVWVIGDKISNGNRTLTSFKHAISCSPLKLIEPSNLCKGFSLQNPRFKCITAYYDHDLEQPYLLS